MSLVQSQLSGDEVADLGDLLVLEQLVVVSQLGLDRFLVDPLQAFAARRQDSATDWNDCARFESLSGQSSTIESKSVVLNQFCLHQSTEDAFFESSEVSVLWLIDDEHLHVVALLLSQKPVLLEVVTLPIVVIHQFVLLATLKILEVDAVPG